MPRRRQVKSLRELCLHYIAQNEARYCWCEDSFQQRSSVRGSFECLPPELREQLWKVLVKSGKLRMSHIPIFFHSNLTEVDLSQCSTLIELNPSSILRTLFTKCKKLKRLNLKQLFCISAEILCELPTELTNLTHLNVHGNYVDDQACAALGRCCHQLVELDLSDTHITDQGMINLCSSSPDGMKKCTKLRKLEVQLTDVTVEGVKVVLQNVLGIQYLIHDQLYQAVAGLHEDYTEGQIIPPEHQYQLRLMDLDALYGEICEDDLRIFVAYCPSITELCVHYNKKPGIWPILHSVRGLVSLDAGDLVNTEFSPSVLPFLQVSGGTLRSLRLEFISHIDLAVIGALCPLLESLVIALYRVSVGFEMFSRNTNPDIIRAGNAHRFKQLATFTIEIKIPYSSRDLDLSEVLMYSKKVKRISFRNVHQFDDALLDQVLRVNPLKQLEVLTLHSCDRISGAAVSQLLLMENNLSRLDFMRCRNITRADRNNMMILMEEGHMDISV